MTFRIGYSLKPGSSIRRQAEVDLEQLWSCHTIGSPGGGKSTFLGRLADACVGAEEGVLLIDPRGDLARDVVLKTEHPDKLVYIAPGAWDDLTPTLNILEVDKDHPRRTKMADIAADNLITMFEHIGRYDPTFVNVKKYLEFATKLTFTMRQPTIRDVILVLLDEKFRARLLDKTDSPDQLIFWKRYNSLSAYNKQNQVDSTLNRLWDFLNSKPVAFFTGAPTSTLRLTQWLDEGRLVVFNLGMGLSKEDSRRIGNLLMAHLTTQYAFREGELVDWNTDRRWRLIVDEFHELAPSPFANIIRQGRYFNFFPVVAHQDMAQLDPYPQLKGSLGHSAELQFRRSRYDTPPTSYRAQEDFIASQEAMARHSAVWTMSDDKKTTHTTLTMMPWEVDAKPQQLIDAMGASKEFFIPRSDVPSLRLRYDQWVAGTMGTDEATARPGTTNKKAPRKNPPPPRDEPAVDGADTTRPPGSRGYRRIRMDDLAARSQTPLPLGDDFDGDE